MGGSFFGATGAPPPRPGGSLGRYEGQAGVLNIQTRLPAYLPFQAEASYQEPEAAYRIQTLPLSQNELRGKGE